MKKPVGLAVASALLALAAAAEPPDKPGLVCTVLSQRVGDGMSLEVRFQNETDSDLSLAPGPHLVWYRDPKALEPMDNTARATRLQNAPLIVPPGGTRVALFAVERRALEEMRCNPATPSAAALYFYQFNQRPQFRCMLQAYKLREPGLKTDCNSSAPSSNEAAGK